MLGCHDFCGYYEWTFHHLRQAHGQRAVRAYWSDAIGGESQQVYRGAAERAGLRGLLEVWTKTGQDENCDWTFTLDEQRNVLRWDMRACPSKGFLLANDLNADEDYCDHCMGWIVPLLENVGVELAAHQHNHRGQCWAEMLVKDSPHAPLNLPANIRADPRWQSGYVHTFIRGQPMDDDVCDVLLRRFAECSSIEAGIRIVTDTDWLRSPEPGTSRAIILSSDAERLRALAARWLALPQGQRPLLFHAYFPRAAPIAFEQFDLPRPLPLLPPLIRSGVYEHIPGAASPSIDEQAALLVRAITTLLQVR